MGRIIKPPEIKTQVNTMKNILNKDKEMLQEALEETQAFRLENGLQGNAWTGMKDQISAHDAVIKGLICMIEAGDKLVSECGSENLDEERLEEQLKNFEQNIDTCSDAIDSYNRWLQNEIYETCLGWYARSMIFQNEQLINIAEEKIQIAKDKLAEIERVDAATKDLTSSVNTLRTSASQGLAYLSSSWTGKGYIPAVVRNVDWMNALSGSWNTHLEKKQKEITKLLDSMVSYTESGDMIKWGYNYDELSKHDKEVILAVIRKFEATTDLSLIGIDENATKEQIIEKISDYRMKETIRMVNKRDAYSVERWESGSIKDRRKMLTDYMNEIESVYGVDIKKDINYYEDKPSSYGYYSHGTKQISVNEYYLEKDSAYNYQETLDTLRHEIRHAFQHAVIDNPDKYNEISQVTRERWKNNSENYIKYEDNPKGYTQQPLEADAWDFGGVQ